MPKRSSITLAGQNFRSIDAANQFVRERLASYPLPGIVTGAIDHALLLELIARHPERSEKMGVGIARFHVQLNQTNRMTVAGNPVVEVIIERVDGSRADVSWKTCVRGVAASSRQNLINAMRQAVKDDINHFKQARFRENSACEICKKEMPDDFAAIHVDHDPMFIEIAEHFLASRSDSPVAFADCPTTHAATFRDEDATFACTWRQHHNEHARLRLVHRLCNEKRPRSTEVQ